MWFIGVEVEQETSAPPPEKMLDPPLGTMLEMKKQRKIKRPGYLVLSSHASG